MTSSGPLSRMNALTDQKAVKTAHPIAHPDGYFWRLDKKVLHKNISPVLKNLGWAVWFTRRRSQVRVLSRPPLKSIVCKQQRSPIKCQESEFGWAVVVSTRIPV
jgi:hypothetical protein